MNFQILIISLACLLAGPTFAQTATAQRGDWAKHERYAAANDTLSHAPDVVFMGNSITDFWHRYRPEFFESHNFAGRGIAGQVTSQMLCRFKADVLDLHPRAVVILAGINDLAENQGYIPIPYIVDNVESMADLALSHGITPVVCLCTPANHVYWRPELQNFGQLVREYNTALREMCTRRGITIVDYYTPLVDVATDGIRDRYSDDGLHPNTVAYQTILEPTILAALAGITGPAGTATH